MSPGLLNSFWSSVVSVDDPIAILGADLVAWYKRGTEQFTDAGSTLVSAHDDHVYQWNDQSGGGHHLVQSDDSNGNRPHLSTSQTHLGVDSLRFKQDTIVGRYFSIPSAVGSALSGAGQGEIWIVLKATSDDNASVAKGLHIIGSDSAVALYTYTDGQIYDTFGTTARKTVGDPASDLSSQFRVYHTHSASADWKAFLDNVQIFTTGSNTVGFLTSGLFFGLSVGGAQRLDAWVVEIVISKGIADSTKRAAMHTYLTTPPASTSVFKTITTDHTKGGATGDVSNFAMLFHETLPDFKSISHGGKIGNANDIRFATDNAATSLLAGWEIIFWDGRTGEITAILDIGTHSHTSDGVYYIVGDGACRTSYLGGAHGAVWDSNTLTVITGGDGHDEFDLTDHTTHANDGVSHLEVQGAGPNGLGAIDSWDAASRNVRCPNLINIAHATLECLVMLPVIDGSIAPRTAIVGFIAAVDGSFTAEKNIAVTSTGKVSLYVYDGAVKEAVSSGSLTAGVWAYVLCRADGTNAQILINGSQDGTIAAGNTYTSYTDPGLQIQGRSQGGVVSSAGRSKVSMVRLSDIARDDNYALATANSFLSPSTFYAVT